MSTIPTYTCRVEGCARQSHTRGWCQAHYTRWRRHGDALYCKPTLNERFWAKVHMGHDCWIWTGGRSGDGYGRFRIAPGRKVGAHRWAYEQLVAPIPEGLTIDHLCRNPACVNPAHMEPVTSRENTLRGISPPATHAVKTECIHGHPFLPQNIYIRRNGRPFRFCRKCLYRRIREYETRRKAGYVRV